MRISFVLPYAGLSGGIRVIATYADSLCKRGHQVFVLSSGLRAPSLRDRIKTLLGLAPGLPPQLLESHFDGLKVTHRRLDCWRPVSDEDLPDADVVVATWWETAEWVAKLSPAKGVKVYFVQGYELPTGPFAERLRRTWRMPMHKIAVAPWLAELGRTEFSDEHIDVVPNAVCTEQFDAPPRGKQPRPTVGMVYSTAPCKGCDIMIAAVEMARKRLPDLELVSFGTEAEAKTLPLPSRSTYLRLPDQSSLRSIYAGCDAWLFGSRCEGFGLPILEAMACRTPVIATPAGAAPQLVVGGAGFLVAPEDPAGMSEAILRVCSMSDEAWRAISDRAYSLVRQYSWEDATLRFEAALKRAVDQSLRGDFPGQPASCVLT